MTRLWLTTPVRPRRLRHSTDTCESIHPFEERKTWGRAVGCRPGSPERTTTEKPVQTCSCSLCPLPWCNCSHHRLLQAASGQTPEEPEPTPGTHEDLRTAALVAQMSPHPPATWAELWNHLWGSSKTMSSLHVNRRVSPDPDVCTTARAEGCRDVKPLVPEKRRCNGGTARGEVTAARLD